MTKETDEKIKITAELTADQQVCKFILERTLLEDWTLIFRSKDESLGSPLIDALFDVEGVAMVRVSGRHVTITKDSPEPWPKLAAGIGKSMRAVLSQDVEPISEEALDAVRNAPAEDMSGTIEQLFETHINPALASHGGFVRLVKIEDRDVFVEMGGGCQGCSASQATMKHGIEQAIRQVVPQVREIVDVTDHAAGDSPYYS